MTRPDHFGDAFPDQAREALASGLPAHAVRRLLLDVATTRTATVRPADVVRQWTQDRFVRPATADPRRLAEVEARLWRLLPRHVVGVELSPVAPLGTACAVADVGQDRVVTTTRLTEVVSDSTNALAVEAAVRRAAARAARRRGDGTDDGTGDGGDPPEHLATCQRQLRAQWFGAGAAAHFRLFCLVSSGRDRGSGRTEAALLLEHLRIWQAVLVDVVPDASPQVQVTSFEPGAVRDRWHDTVLPALRADGSRVPVVEDPDRTRARHYYAGLALRIVARTSDGEVSELGDGGLTTWTARLLGDAKERCLVSCLATERLAALVPG